MVSREDPKFMQPPKNAASLLPSEARQLFRRNGYNGPTDFCAGYLQANVVILPGELADDFGELCRRNHGPFPLLYRSKPAEVGAPPLAKDSDIRTDLTRYLVYSKGKLVEDTFDLQGFSWENRVTFYLGCSSIFEDALVQAGIKGRNVSMYKTNIRLYKVGAFDCEMFVSMRPIHRDLVAKAIAITAQFPDAHGAPIHIGDPTRIGIMDLAKPTDWNPVEVKDGEVPVFWACGFTVKEVVMSAKPDLAFTHYAGSMFITDIIYQPKQLDIQPTVVPLSRDDSPFFASIVDQKTVEVFSNLEQAVLDDPGNRGVAHLFQKSDFMKTVLVLSHANKVAITTGFPCHTEYDVREETNGLPGALAICQAVLALGKEATLISDSGNQALFESCVSHMVSIGALKSQIPVIPYARVKEIYDTASSSGSDAPFDCFLAIKRLGRAADGTYRTMKGRDVSQYLDPIDDLFLQAHSNPHISTIGIGDSGNELGMGKVYNKIKQYISLGETIACAVPSDFVIFAGVSNWGGYAVALGLYTVSICPLHWWYRNHGINAKMPPDFSVNLFLPNVEQTTSLLKYMNGLGIRDGHTGSLDQSVDGMPLNVHLKKLEELRTIVAK